MSFSSTENSINYHLFMSKLHHHNAKTT